MRVICGVIAAGLYLCSGTALAQGTRPSPFGLPSTPAVVGKKTATGLLILSQDPAAKFSLSLEGAEIKPVDSDHLRWQVGDLNIELTSAARQVLVPGGDNALATLEQFHAASFHEKTNHGQTDNDKPEAFSCGTGNGCLLWSDAANKGSADFTAAATDGKVLLLLRARAVPVQAQAHARTYLEQTMQTVQFGVLAPESRLPSVARSGLSVQQQLNLMAKVFGLDHTALLNNQLATPTDRALGGVLPLDPGTLVEVLKFAISTQAKPAININVFDGSVAHAVTALAYDRPSHSFEYQDPWGARSFLQAGNNQAQVSAVPHASKGRVWVVKEDELQRVLYAVFQPATTVMGEFRLFNALAGPPGDAVEMFHLLGMQKPANSVAQNHFAVPQTDDTYLRLVEKYLVESGHVDQTLTVFQIRCALDPAIEATRPKAAQTLRDSGHGDLADKISRPYAPALLASFVSVNRTAAEASNFFKFFHLKESVSTPQGNDALSVAYKPSGAMFRDLVDLGITWHNEQILTMTLRMDQSFIQSSDTAPFAADLAKSFLKFAFPSTSGGAIAQTEKEIDTWWRSPLSFVPVPGAERATRIPAMPSLAYAVFAGADHGPSMLPMINGQLIFAHVNEAGRTRLAISILPASSASSPGPESSPPRE